LSTSGVTLRRLVRHTVYPEVSSITKIPEEKSLRIEPFGSTEKMMPADAGTAHIFALILAHKFLNSVYEFAIKPESSYRALAS
jgi:hypothetical protein